MPGQASAAPTGMTLDTVLVIVISAVLAWFGFKWSVGGKGIKRGLGMFMLLILLYNVLSWSNYWAGLLDRLTNLENTAHTALFRAEGRQA